MESNPEHPGHATTGELRALFNVTCLADGDGEFGDAEWSVSAGRSSLTGVFDPVLLTWHITGSIADGEDDIEIDFFGNGIVIEAIEPISVGAFVTAAASVIDENDNQQSGPWYSYYFAEPTVALSVRVPN